MRINLQGGPLDGHSFDMPMPVEGLCVRGSYAEEPHWYFHDGSPPDAVGSVQVLDHWKDMSAARVPAEGLDVKPGSVWEQLSLANAKAAAEQLIVTLKEL